MLPSRGLNRQGGLIESRSEREGVLEREREREILLNRTKTFTNKKWVTKWMEGNTASWSHLKGIVGVNQSLALLSRIA